MRRCHALKSHSPTKIDFADICGGATLINNNELGEKCNLDPKIIIQKLVMDRDNKVFAYRWLKKVEKARAWAEQQNWVERAKEWEDLCK